MRSAIARTSLLHLDDDALGAVGITRLVVDAPNAYPCRISLEDALPGEEVLLLSYAHQSARTPYAAADCCRYAPTIIGIASWTPR